MRYAINKAIDNSKNRLSYNFKARGLALASRIVGGPVLSSIPSLVPQALTGTKVCTKKSWQNLGIEEVTGYQ